MAELKYKAQLQQHLKDLFLERWMNESDWQEIESEFLAKSGLSYEQLEQDLDEGVRNGYSVAFQLNLCRDLFKTFKSR